MAKKKNIVKKGKSSMYLLLIVILVFGWLMAAITIMSADDAVKAQKALIDKAQTFLADKLYVRAVSQYLTALSDYETVNNLTYETELLGIYKEADMMEEYYNLIDSRMKAETASLEEYIDRAQEFIKKKRTAQAMTVLQQAMNRYQDDGLTALYESICYEYSLMSTTFTDVHIPALDWYIPAFDGEHWGYIGKNGRTVLDFSYEEATQFAGNYAVVKIDGVYTLIDKNGYWNAVDKNNLDAVTAISGSRLAGVKDGRYGIYTNTFSMLGTDTYNNIYLSDNGIIAVQKDGKWAFLNSNLEAVTDYCFTDVTVNSRGQVFSGNYAVVADEEGYFLVNQSGQAYFDARFAQAKGMEGGFFAVADASGRWGFANEKAEIIVECQYEDVFSFSNRLAAVKYAGKWGYINQYNTMVIEAQYSQAYPFLAGSALVVDDLGNYRILTLKNYSLF